MNNKLAQILQKTARVNWPVELTPPFVFIVVAKLSSSIRTKKLYLNWGISKGLPVQVSPVGG